MDGKIKNTALKTALSFNYQMLIGLERCFSLKTGQSICFEKDGDVSLISDDINNASQIEVKNYANPLTDHHENLWKTLSNWLNPQFHHEIYGSLILHTTQSFGSKTRLKNWNNETADQRINILKEIFEERQPEEINAEKPKEIVVMQKSVIQADPNTLKNVLEKVTLFTEYDDSESLKNKILSKLIGIPENNKESYLNGLVGYVYNQANGNSWKVKQSDFTAKCEELTSTYRKKEFTFPPFEGYEASELDISQLNEKVFVQKIHDIEHNEVISDAIGNWLELQNSLNQELDEYPLYREKTNKYQDEIIKIFQRKYSTSKLKLSDIINDSKILYNETISEHPLNMGSEIPPIEYKNGLIHDAMDDSNRHLKWRIEK